MTNFFTAVVLIANVVTTVGICAAWADITDNHFPQEGYRDPVLNVLYGTLCVAGFGWLVFTAFFTADVIEPPSWYLPIFCLVMVSISMAAALAPIRLFRRWGAHRIGFFISSMALGLALVLSSFQLKG